MTRPVLKSLLNVQHQVLTSAARSRPSTIYLGPLQQPTWLLHSRASPTSSVRAYSVDPTPGLDEYELQLFGILNKSLDPAVLDVRDVSGGCGSMFAINVVSEKFNGLSLIKQQRLVNEILKDEISKWHGLQLRTKALDKYKN